VNKKSPIPPGFLKHPEHLLALGFGSGYVPKIPGTAGTLVGILFYLAMQYLHWSIYICIVTMFFLVGIRLCEKTARDLDVHDHSAIVWDEIVGYLVTMFLAPAGWLWIVIGFISFRLFDIWKPLPIRWADQTVKGGFGIMADDVLAGIYALFTLQIIAYLL